MAKTDPNNPQVYFSEAFNDKLVHQTDLVDLIDRALYPTDYSNTGTVEALERQSEASAKAITKLVALLVARGVLSLDDLKAMEMLQDCREYELVDTRVIGRAEPDAKSVKYTQSKGIPVID